MQLYLVSTNPIKCTRYIVVIFLCINQEKHPLARPRGQVMCLSWVQIKPKFYQCNCCAVCTIVSYITAIYTVYSIMKWIQYFCGQPWQSQPSWAPFSAAQPVYTWITIKSWKVMWNQHIQGLNIKAHILQISFSQAFHSIKVFRFWSIFYWSLFLWVQKKKWGTEIMAWHHQATSHYLWQCVLNSMMPYGITGHNELRINHAQSGLIIAQSIITWYCVQYWHRKGRT